jgi:hypothetical protein
VSPRSSEASEVPGASAALEASADCLVNPDSPAKMVSPVKTDSLARMGPPARLVIRPEPALPW